MLMQLMQTQLERIRLDEKDAPRIRFVGLIDCHREELRARCRQHESCPSGGAVVPYRRNHYWMTASGKTCEGGDIDEGRPPLAVSACVVAGHVKREKLHTR